MLYAVRCMLYALCSMLHLHDVCTGRNLIASDLWNNLADFGTIFYSSILVMVLLWVVSPLEVDIPFAIHSNVCSRLNNRASL